jgi:peptidoglycan hydrolase CwlO-like protein
LATIAPDQEQVPSAPTREMLVADAQRKLILLNNKYLGLIQVLEKTHIEVQKIREYDKNHTHLEALMKEEIRIKNEICALEKELQALCSKIEQEQETNALLHKKYTNLLQKKGYKDAEKRHLQQECETLEYTISSMYAEGSKINQELFELKENYVSSYADRALQEMHQDLKREVAKGHHEHHTLFSSIQDQQKRIEELQQKNKESEYQNEQLKERLQRERKDISQQAKSLYESAKDVKTDGRATFDELFLKSSDNEREEARSLAISNQDRDTEEFLYAVIQDHKKGIIEKHPGKIGVGLGAALGVFIAYKFVL